MAPRVGRSRRPNTAPNAFMAYVLNGCDRVDCMRLSTTKRHDVHERYGPRGYDHPFCAKHAAEWDQNHEA